MTEVAGVLTVFYDGGCPRCRRDRARFERWAPEAGVYWCDINGQETRLRAEGIDPALALRSLHVKDAEGALWHGMEAYRRLFAFIWWLKPLGWLITRSWVSPWLTWLYRRWVDRRLCRQGRG